MKTSKRFLALVLSALMIFSVVIIPGVDMSMFGIEADAAVTLGGITQQRVVSNYESLYAGYQSRFFGGSDTNWPTNFVIPGLSKDNDYTPQGMTYWEEKEWILISAYDASGSGKNSVIYALDAVTTDFVALFKVVNQNGTVNTSHGGGIAASEYNFYYADNASKVSYVPLSEMDVPKGTVKEIKLVDSIDCSGELNGAASSYCCYEDGVLWVGNFHWMEENYNRYETPAHPNYYSMLLGYKLHGNSSAEEWYYLSTNRAENKVKVNNTNSQTIGATTFTSTVNTNNKITINGSVNTSSALGEATAEFGYLYLVEGQEYVIEFTADNNLSDMYMFAPNSGGHCNVKQSVNSKITALGDGRYHYTMTFTAGLKPNGADSSWPTTQSTNESYTGKYTIRFDQDSVPAGGRTFAITDFSVTKKYTAPEFTVKTNLEGVNCEGNPTYCIAFENTNTSNDGGTNANIDRVQYAMVSKGKVYISRSWSRNGSGNHTRELAIADLDINSPGNVTATINGRSRDVHYVTNASLTHFGGDYKDENKNLNQMLFMGEALCVINDYLYMFSEGAAWTYNGKDSSSTCDEPIDVIWKIDQHALTGTPRPVEEVKSLYYEKVDSTAEIVSGEEYLVVFESNEKDPVTQKNILYALDSFGGYDNSKLPKKTSKATVTAANTLDSIGVIGYPITDYSTGTVDGNDVIYLNKTDDSLKSIRWTITNDSNRYYFQNSDYYYGTNRYLCVNGNIFAMTSDPEIFGINDDDNGGFKIENGDYRLWCNAGYTEEHLKLYTTAYKNHYQTGFVPAYNNLEEVKGTFHSNTKDAVLDSEYGQISLYKKVKDPYVSTLETDVYTDLTAELQADGTYTVNLETYATAAVQYMTLKNERPTDFIFVLDNSTYMNTSDIVGYHCGDGWNTMSIESACGSKDHTEKPGSTGVHGYEYHGGFYYKTADGRYCPIYAAIKTTDLHKSLGTSWNCTQYYWVYYRDTNGLCYMMYSDGTVSSTGISLDQLKTNVNNNSSPSATVKNNNNSTRKGTTVYTGPHYKYNGKDDEADTRMDVARDFINRMTYKIAADNSQHRVALITYGSPAVSYFIDDNGNESQKASLSASDIPNAFYNNSEFSKFRAKVNSIRATEGTTASQPYNGVSRAANTVLLGNTDYSATGDRAAVIFVLTGTDRLSVADDAATVTNDAIKAAKAAKEYGAFVYTVKVGQHTNNYTENFLNYTSSNYINATSVSTPGEPNKLTTGFNLSLSSTSYNIEAEGKTFLDVSTEKSKYAPVQVNKTTIIREYLGQFFNTTNAVASYKQAEAEYDGLGRLYFKEDKATDLKNSVTASFSGNTVSIEGFDFSSEYVSTANTAKNDGSKLIVSISGLTLNTGDAIDNEKVSEDATGIYLKNGIKRKGYPTDYVNVPEYTYVLDYGISMLDTDVNGTLLSIDDAPVKQSPYKNGLAIDDKNNNVIVAMTADKKDLLYSLKPDASGTNNSAYCLIDREDGTYDWFKLNIVPASNVYFEEENAVTLTTGNQPWTLEKDKAFDFSQELTSANDVYGYDVNYKSEGSGFSHGSVYTSSVNDKYVRSDTLAFDYTGTAIDLYGSCGENTGIYIFTIKNEDGGIEKVYITDTYLSDSSLYTAGNQINQVPILHHENSGYGKYTVEVTSAFLASMVGQRNPVRTFGLRDTDEGVEFNAAEYKEDVIEAILSYAEMEDLMGEDIEISFCDENSVLNGGSGANVETTFGFFAAGEEEEDNGRKYDSLTNYFDGFRVYEPGDSGFGDGAYPVSEQGAVYYNVIDNLLVDTADIDAKGIGYIEKVGNEEYDLGKYASNGPKSELYLKPNTSITFTLTATNPNAKAMVSLRALNKAATVAISAGTDNFTKDEYEITHSNEQYYRINCAEFDENGKATITIQNTSKDAYLVVDTIKICNGLMATMMMSSMPRVRMMMSAPATAAEPNAPETEEIPEIPAPEAPPVVEPLPEEPSTEPETPDVNDGTDDNEEKNLLEQITEKFTEVLNMIQSMLDKIVSLLKSIMA